MTVLSRTAVAAVALADFGTAVVAQEKTDSLDKFAGAVWMFNGASWSAVMQVLTERYGKPTNIRTNRMQNSLGQVDDPEVATWVGAGAVAVAQEWQMMPGGTPSLRVHSRAYLDRQAEKDKAKAESAPF